MSEAHTLPFEITPQPTETTCGAAALQSVYRFWGRKVTVERAIREIEHFPDGGTWAVHLGRDALARGFVARIYTCDLQLFDPSWFWPGAGDLADSLRRQLDAGSRAPREDEQLRAYLDFLERGGEVRMEEIGTDLVSRYVRGGMPVVAGLSSTWLYRSARERWEGERSVADDLRGTPTGHFVVVHGVDPRRRTFDIADPFLQRPFPGRHDYSIPIRRFFNALMLGVVTNDAKLLAIRPADREA